MANGKNRRLELCLKVKLFEHDGFQNCIIFHTLFKTLALYILVILKLLLGNE